MVESENRPIEESVVDPVTKEDLEVYVSLKEYTPPKKKTQETLSSE